MTSITTKHLLELMEYVDSIQTKIPDGIFLELCNKLKNTYLFSKQREEEVIELFKDIKELNEYETDAQQEHDEEEAYKYCSILHKMESQLRQLEHMVEYKLIKRNEYNKFNDDDITCRIDCIEQLLIENST